MRRVLIALACAFVLTGGAHASATRAPTWDARCEREQWLTHVAPSLFRMGYAHGAFWPYDM